MLLVGGNCSWLYINRMLFLFIFAECNSESMKNISLATDKLKLLKKPSVRRYDVSFPPGLLKFIVQFMYPYCYELHKLSDHFYYYSNVFVVLGKLDAIRGAF